VGNFKDIALTVEQALLAENCKQELFKLEQKNFFAHHIPEIHKLQSVPQNKQRSSNALHHSILVATNVQNIPELKWAAFLHDIGKIQYKISADGSFEFFNHEYNGSKIAKQILKRLQISKSGDICHLIRYHSHPLDYQRQPNWKLSTIKNFYEKHRHLSFWLIDLAIADKIASSGQSTYLEPLYKLKTTLEEMSYGKK
jgi:poly(A) polymerase